MRKSWLLAPRARLLLLRVAAMAASESAAYPRTPVIKHVKSAINRITGHFEGAPLGGMMMFICRCEPRRGACAHTGGRRM